MILRNLLRPAYLLAVGSALAAILIGLRHLGALPEYVDVQSATNGIMLVTLGAVILGGFLGERKELRAAEGKLLSNITLSDVIALTLTVPAISLGVAEIIGIRFSSEISGVIGILYIILSVVMLFSVSIEERQRQRFRPSGQ
jgi:UDP-N-acetylmuramyl pentapeptide phosphotransferase/UDP-N-acetylglucosamine-1-phosphate transferase